MTRDGKGARVLRPRQSGRPTHRKIRLATVIGAAHGNNRFGLPALTNLDVLPPQGALLITPPLKIRQGSGSPARVLALVEN